jgi:hypothetical protein
LLFLVDTAGIGGRADVERQISIIDHAFDQTETAQIRYGDSR